MSEAPRIFGPKFASKKAAPKAALKPAVDPIVETHTAGSGTDYDVAELNAQRIGQILKRVLARRKRSENG